MTTADGDHTEFDRDTAVEQVDEHRYRTELSDRWGHAVPNGGYLLATVQRAVGMSLPHPHAFSSTAHYLAPASPGPAEIEVEVLRTGRGHSTAVARLFQEGRERVHVTTVFGDLDRTDGPTVVHAEPPPLPPLEACVQVPPDVGMPEIFDRFDVRFHPDTLGFATGQRPGVGISGGWYRFVDGREPDVLSLGLWVDAAPPAVFNLVDAGEWVPTLELTTQVRDVPAPGWLRLWFRTRVLVRGYLEEDGEVWDSDGKLVAQSRQLARLRA